MGQDWLYDALQCPKCKEEFEVDRHRERNGEVRYGWLVCGCDEYPVVAGVPVIRDDPLTRLSGRLLEREKYGLSVNVLLQTGGKLHWRISYVLQNLGGLALGDPPRPLKWYLTNHAKLTGGEPGRDAMFADVLLDVLFDQGIFHEYLLYRPFEHSFWNLHAFMSRIDGRDDALLDFGGGAGHASQLINKATGRKTCNADIKFPLVYLYKNYLHSSGAGVVVDPKGDLPFRRECFGSVLDMDGFHYVSDKYKTAREYERVARDDGELMLLHTHTSGSEGGEPLQPEGYLDAFSWDGAVISETELLNKYLGSGSEFTVSDSGSVTGDVNVVLTQNESGESELSFDGFFEDVEIDDGSVTVNPIYRVESTQPLHLVRRDVPDGFREEFSFSFEYTEEEYGDDVDPVQLFKRGVFTFLPENYCRDCRLDAGSASKP